MEKSRNLDLNIMKDLSEQVSYNHPAFPVCVVKKDLKSISQMQTACHWHEDVEFSIPVKGSLSYCINDKVFQIRMGDAVFVNARQLHYGLLDDMQECEFICITFHPSVVTMNSYMTESYITPVTENFKCTEHIFYNDNKEDQKTISLLNKLYKLYQQNDKCRELLAIQILSAIWTELYNVLGGG